jgi:hypothetical protein
MMIASHMQESKLLLVVAQSKVTNHHDTEAIFRKFPEKDDHESHK